MGSFGDLLQKIQKKKIKLFFVQKLISGCPNIRNNCKRRKINSTVTNSIYANYQKCGAVPKVRYGTYSGPLVNMDPGGSVGNMSGKCLVSPNLTCLGP